MRECRGSAGGEELRTRQTGENIKEAEGEDSTYCRILQAPLVTRWEVKMLFTPFYMRFFFLFWKRMAVVFKNEDNLNSKSVPNEVPFIRPCASEIPPWSLSENTVIQVAKCNDMLLPSAYYSSHV